MEWIRLILAIICMIMGLLMEMIAVFGIYKFKFVMNRMHAAAIGDTMALFLITVSLLIMNGFSLFSLKLIVTWGFLWMASAVSSHVLCRMEVTIDEKSVRENCEVDES